MELFEYIYVNNIWGKDAESRSGPGSTLSYTTNIRQEIQHLLSKVPIRTFFDAPCGDFNWMKAVEFPSEVKYIGGDISPSMIADLTKAYASESRAFRVFDIASDIFPRVDIWFCRDCLFHLSNRAILSALTLFAASEIPLIFTSNHINLGFENSDIETGGFRLLDLYAPPFELPKDTLFYASDGVFPYPRREMCLWTREQVAAALPKMRDRILAS
jgi:hypothetical protein